MRVRGFPAVVWTLGVWTRRKHKRTACVCLVVALERVYECNGDTNAALFIRFRGESIHGLWSYGDGELFEIHVCPTQSRKFSCAKARAEECLKQQSFVRITRLEKLLQLFPLVDFNSLFGRAGPIAFLEFDHSARVSQRHDPNQDPTIDSFLVKLLIPADTENSQDVLPGDLPEILLCDVRLEPFEVCTVCAVCGCALGRFDFPQKGFNCRCDFAVCGRSTIRNHGGV